MSITVIAAHRRDALLGLWQQGTLQQVTVDSAKALPGVVDSTGVEQDDKAEQLGRRRVTDVVCLRNPGPPDQNASAWVASGYSGYRAAYLAFVKHVYGVSAAPTDLKGFDVDHLLNRARTPENSTLVRIEAIPSAVNQAWGQFYEKAASDQRFFANTAREKRTMSWMVASKLAGQMPPQGPDDAVGIRRLVDFWVTRGFPREQAQFAITDDLNFVFGRPRGGIVAPTTKWI